MKFLLGTHQPHWVANEEIVKRNAALFISRSSLVRLKSFHPAQVEWHMDSSGFTQLQKYGRWTMSPEQFIADVRRITAGMGPAANYFQMDCMCEPPVIFGTPDLPRTHPMWFHGTHEMRQCKPGSRDDNLDTAVAIHQRLTVENGILLREIAPELPIRFVIQGWTEEHYLQCIRMYRDHGVDLAAEPLVGLGSVCRRQATDEIGRIAAAIHREVPGIQLHGFGMAIPGARKHARWFKSNDTTAWSAAARNRKILLDECRDDPNVKHKNCANCVRWALIWRDEVITTIAESRAAARAAAARPRQLDLLADLDLELAS